MQVLERSFIKWFTPTLDTALTLAEAGQKLQPGAQPCVKPEEQVDPETQLCLGILRRFALFGMGFWQQMQNCYCKPCAVSKRTSRTLSALVAALVAATWRTVWVGRSGELCMADSLLWTCYFFAWILWHLQYCYCCFCCCNYHPALLLWVWQFFSHPSSLEQILVYPFDLQRSPVTSAVPVLCSLGGCIGLTDLSSVRYI